MNSHLRFNQPTFRRHSGMEHSTEQAPRTFERVVRVVTSDSLFRGTHEIGIEHEGSMYRLKITRQGKLILNK